MNTNKQSKEPILLGVDYGDIEGDLTTKIYGYVEGGMVHIVAFRQFPTRGPQRGTWIVSKEHL